MTTTEISSCLTTLDINMSEIAGNLMGLTATSGLLGVLRSIAVIGGVYFVSPYLQSFIYSSGIQNILGAQVTVYMSEAITVYLILVAYQRGWITAPSSLLL